MSTERATPWNIDRLLAETFVADVEVHPSLPSTNDRALALASYGKPTLPTLIIADEQTKGRGRGGNVWWSSTGALTFSLLMKLSADALPLSRWPEMSLTVGSSVCAAVSHRLPKEDVRLKWPNDVYLRGRKLCGVLVEVPPSMSEKRMSGQVVIGIGLNVSNSAKNAPAELRERAIGLSDVGSCQSREEVLIDVLQSLSEQLELLQTEPASIRRRWRQYDLLTGRTVTVGDGDNTLTGTSVGIDDDGALLLRTESGTRRIYGGVVQSFV